MKFGKRMIANSIQDHRELRGKVYTVGFPDDNYVLDRPIDARGVVKFVIRKNRISYGRDGCDVEFRLSHRDDWHEHYLYFSYDLHKVLINSNGALPRLFFKNYWHAYALALKMQKRVKKLAS